MCYPSRCYLFEFGLDGPSLYFVCRQLTICKHKPLLGGGVVNKPADSWERTHFPFTIQMFIKKDELLNLTTSKQTTFK